MALLFVVALLLGVGRPASAQAGGWWKSYWKARRRVKASVPAGVEADEPVAVATFLTHGRLKPDGSDIRVIARGREVPSRVLNVGPGDEVRIAFQLLVGVESYQIYYGNPKAERAAYDWNINAGVLLEVRKYRGGGFGSLRQALATWKKSKDVLGVDFVPKVYLGHNPFGPSIGFMAHYAGWLRIERAGRYEFYTTSSHGSFLLIDGKEVVSWPGWHGAARRAVRRGSIDLQPGRYKLEYYHVHPSGRPSAVAAWKPPGTLRPVVIPARAFLPVARAVVQPAQVYRRQVTPDFDFKRYEAFLEPGRNTFLYRCSFRDLTRGIDRRYYRPLWDFGDGITSNVWMPSHVYLSPGTYTVTYQLKGVRGTYATKQRIVVERDWSQQASPGNVEPLKDYYEAVRAYDFRKMPAGSLLAACEMFDRLKRYDDLVRVGRILVFETPEVGDEALLGEAERLAQRYLEKRRDAASAVEVYLKGEERVRSADAKARLATRAASALVEHLFAVDRARDIYKRALDVHKSAKPETRRQALMGLAEVAVLTGDAEEARRLLARAASIPVAKPEQGGPAVRVGSLSRAVEDYIRRDEFGAAKSLLDTWEWEFPLDRLVGYSTLLRARLCIRREEYQRAVRLLTSLVKVNPRSNYAAEALMAAGACRLKSGDKAKARDTYKQVLSDYPESPCVKGALERLEKLE